MYSGVVPKLSNLLLPLTHQAIQLAPSDVQQGYAITPSADGNHFVCHKGNHISCSGTTCKEVLIVNLLQPRAFSVKTDPNVLHNALGHPSLPYLKAAYPEIHISSVGCCICDVSKMHQQPFPGSFPPVQHVLNIIHMDICGPITPASRGGNQYFLKIIDGHSKFRFIYPMPRKSNTYSHFLTFLNRAENFTGHSFKAVVSANSGEFINHKFAKLFQTCGIIHHTTAPYTPQQNPFAQRGN
jgi:hypothetical protein